MRLVAIGPTRLLQSSSTTYVVAPITRPSAAAANLQIDVDPFPIRPVLVW
jgi:hypothetical protein